LLLGSLGLASSPLSEATINKTFCVGSLSKSLSGQSVNFWGFYDCGAMGGGTVPGPILEIGTNDTLKLTLNVNMMTPQESSPNHVHTVKPLEMGMYGAIIVRQRAATCCLRCLRRQALGIRRWSTKNCATTRLMRPFTAKSLFKRARFG
jgi:hypothetical protein